MGTPACTPLFDEDPPPRDTYILDHGFGFNPETWRRRLPDGIDLPAWFGDFPRAGRWPRITRGDLLREGAAADTGRAAVDILIGAYTWGHGLPARRGPARLRQVFDRNNGRVEQHLGEALRLLRDGGPLAAYQSLSHGGDRRLRRLGASFFTKLLYFLGWDSAAGSRRPLIMDQYVVIGLNACRSTEWDPLGPWTADQYGEYLSWAQEKAGTWGVGTEADVVERAVWAYGSCLARRR
ncbi:8-oxoguanine DNA glycosylase OGG fold protein [Micromonospora chersina]|uniref:8-oxoguanine DNA glycosylase OGG fold protein n=1 Tax=Micromonospora chersina TaxID=47854 RepID=UPI00372125B1